MEIRRMVATLWKRSWIIALITLVSCVVTGLCSYYLLQPIYQATTKLIVSTTTIEEGVPQLTWENVNLNIQLIATYKELIKTAAIMEEVLRENPHIDLTVDELIKKVNVDSVNDTQVMTVIVEDTSYERAVQIVNSVSEVFQAKVIEMLNVNNVTILNVAQLSGEAIKPIWPSPALNIAISFVLSLILGVGIVFLLENLDDSIKSEDDVERYVGLSTLAVISRVEKKDLSTRSKRSGKKVGENVNVATNQ